MDLKIEGGRALIGGQFVETTIEVASADGGVITEIERGSNGSRRFDAGGLLVFPGIVDIHGDGFERQMMPRPGVNFPTDIALVETDRQVVANGITTVFHGVTWSWEPGLRGPENARAILDNLKRLRPKLGADTRFHLRHETYNLDAEAEIIQWLTDRRVDVLAFNDHMTMTVEASNRADKKAEMAKRACISESDFDGLVDRVKRRGNEVPGSIVRIAQSAVANGVPLLSHDDATPEQRRWFRSLGCRVAEFPTTIDAAQEAARGGDQIVFGAPNVVRGGSHTGWTSASEMVARGLCSVLASDYYYPAPLIAAFRLAWSGILPLEQAWDLIAEAPAKSVGLTDRGRIAPGLRGDLVLIDADNVDRPRVVATIAGGRIVYLAEAERLSLV